MFILQRAPYDEFTLRQFVQLSNSLSSPHDAFYISAPMFDVSVWTSESTSVLNEFSGCKYPKSGYCPSPPHFFKNLIKNNIKEEIILIGTKDHFTSDHFNPWSDKKPSIIFELEEIFLAYPNKTFILFSSVENLNYYLNFSNVKIIPWGGDITNQYYFYSELEPVLEKNFNSSKSFLCLNRNHRYHRELVLGYILNENIQDFGIMSCMFQDELNLFRDSFFKFDDANLRIAFYKGREKLLSYKFPIQDNYLIYENLDNDNITNFKNKLINLYKNTFIEIITETSYFEKCFLISEKTSNCIHGCNFPIWISSAGTVNFLRNTGLDVFDDIINHGYDSIQNNTERAYQAINLNKDLLIDNEKVKELWTKNKQRFINNSIFLKTKFLEYYKNRTFNKFNEYKNQL